MRSTSALPVFLALIATACSGGQSQDAGADSAVHDANVTDIATLDTSADDVTDAVNPDANASDALDALVAVDVAADTVDAFDGADRVDVPTDAGPTCDGPCPCPLLTVACPTGCCAVTAVELAPRGSYPSVAYDTAGFIYVSYTISSSGGWGTGLAIFNPTSASWSTQTAGGGGYASVVTVSSTGRVHQAFGGYNGPPYTYRYSDDHGATWTSRVLPPGPAIGGTLDLAIAAGDVPHIVLQRYVSGSVWSALDYLVWNGTTWTTQTLDNGTTLDDHPAIALGFADRPHIFAMAYHPDGMNLSSVRHIFYNGAAWVYENVETGNSYATANDYYSEFQGEVFPDDSVRVVYSRSRAATPELIRADRATGATGTWTPTVLGLPTPFQNALHLDDVAGAATIVADGLNVYRSSAGTAFTAVTATAPHGTAPGVAVHGRSVYVAYTSSDASTSGRLYFSRLDF